ncbi:hypothetical protein INR49_006891 [Caranx melampygus]|nr:hypothetical protein INR49_006891 [Caranx melampygus]
METKLTIIFVLALEITLCGHPTNCPVSEDHFEGTSSVTATVGRDITLPCKHFPGSQDITLLEWIKDAVTAEEVTERPDDWRGPGLREGQTEQTPAPATPE